jgi:hypothetical protein
MPGNYFRVKRATAADVEALTCLLFRDSALLPESLLFADPGDNAVVPEGFDRVEVTSSVDQVVSFQIARGQVSSDRVLGEVSVIDGELSRSRNDRGYLGNAAFGPVAGNFSHVQLWNLPGSGRRLVMNQLTSTLPSGVPSLVEFRHSSFQLPGALNSPLNKRLDGGSSVASFYGVANAAVQANAAFGVLGLDVLFKTKFYRFVGPLIIEPGRGLVVVPAIQNQGVSANFEYFEEVI